MCSAWITASLIKTGFNTRKTTKKGVRRMTKSLKTTGFMHNNAVVVYPGICHGSTSEGDEMELLPDFSAADAKNGKRFLCADGMHRVRCVTELTELKKGGAPDIMCGDSVYAVILRPDTPKKYLIKLSLGKSFTPESIFSNKLISQNTFYRSLCACLIISFFAIHLIILTFGLFFENPVL